MSEKKLFGFMSTEGFILLVLGFCILILPRLTMLSFNTMVGVSFIVYGIYKFISSIVNRELFVNFVCQMLLGIAIFVLGILLQIPRLNIYWLISFIGIYFILESIAASALIAHIRNTLNFWYCKPCISMILLFAGLIILVKLPAISFSSVAIITAVCFILKGSCKKMLGIINAYNEIHPRKNEDI